jgi:hypothetical protein
MRHMRLPGVGDGIANGLGTAGGGWWWLLPLFGLELEMGRASQPCGCRSTAAWRLQQQGAAVMTVRGSMDGFAPILHIFIVINSSM